MKTPRWLAPAALLVLPLLLIPVAVHAQQSAMSPDVEAFHRASYEGDLPKVHEMVSAGAPVDVTDSEGHTGLMWTAFNGHTAVAGYLLENGASINAKDVNGRNALMYAASGPFAECVELLLKRGADVNAQGTLEGFTALMTAAAEGQVEVVRILLAYGADAALKDEDGDTAESFAKEKGHSAVVKLLKNPPPRVDTP